MPSGERLVPLRYGTDFCFEYLRLCVYCGSEGVSPRGWLSLSVGVKNQEASRATKRIRTPGAAGSGARITQVPSQRKTTYEKTSTPGSPSPGYTKGSPNGTLALSYHYDAITKLLLLYGTHLLEVHSDVAKAEQLFHPSKKTFFTYSSFSRSFPKTSQKCSMSSYKVDTLMSSR